jgi:hypothetical protein
MQTYARLLDPGDEVKCSACLSTVTQGRVYDLNVSILDDSGVSARCRGTVSLCDSCRASFDAADIACDEREGR